MILTSWDDYCAENPRIAGLLKKYKLPGIFFIECDELKKMSQIREIHDLGFEIGCHTFSHPADLKLLSHYDLRHEIGAARSIIEEAINDKIKWFCYPKGKFNDVVIREVKNSGFLQARTVRIGFGGPALEKNGFHCFARREYFGKDWGDYLKEMIEKYDPRKGDLHIWGHAFEMNKYNEWDKLEEVLKCLSEKNAESLLG